MQQRFQVSQRATLTRSTLDDELLLRLAAGARGLARLGLRGSGVTADGLRALVLGVPLGSGPADEEDERHSGDAVSAGAAAAASQKPGPGGAAGISHLEVTQSALCCDAGLAVIGELLAGSLRALYAQWAGGGLSDEGLGALHGCEGLRELDVSGSCVTDDGGVGGWRGQGLGGVGG
jgi:hypothetical protein